MTHTSIRLAAGTVLACAMTSLVSGAAAQAATPGQAPAATPTVGESAKNIQVLTDLKDAPRTELINAMQFMAGSLSVTCNFCHVTQQGPYDSDAKSTKLKAREMIRMVRAINESNFGGRQVVTCNTCHQGHARPNAVPTPWYKTTEQLVALGKSVQSPSDTAAAAQSAPILPSVDQVMASYRNAVGTTPISSIHLIGTNEAVTGSRSREVFIVYPDKVALRAIGPNGIQQILNGDHGWVVTPQGATAAAPPLLAALKAYAATVLLPRLDSTASDRKVTGIERLGDRSYYVVESSGGNNSERLYFDIQSGLLYKTQTTLPTVLGTKVEEKTFEDYRDVRGTKLPHLITGHFMEDQITFRVSEIQINIAVDPAKFEPPAPKDGTSESRSKAPRRR